MEFSDILNSIIEEIGCTSKELSKESNISESIISRYKNGDSIPKYGSEKYNNLIDGLTTLSKRYKKSSINYKIIKEKIDNIINKDNIDFDIFRNNLNILINELGINVSDLSKSIGFDSSYVSKIRNGSRKPQDINDFTKNICKYIVNNYSDEIISSVINTTNDIDTLHKWMTNNSIKVDEPINNFLNKLDAFDLNEYIKIIKFDSIKVPTSPITLPKQKKYYGLKGFKESQLDALKSIVLSKSKNDVFFYSNMPMIEASKDLDFTKKFMIGLAFILKKGIHLNMIHNLDRPFKELVIGLEGWIPLYMTGQINPYYFKNNSSEIYSHIQCIHDSITLNGMCINNDIESSTCFLSNKKEDINYNIKYSKMLIKKATPLMDIYNVDKKKELNNFLDKNSNLKINRRNVLYNLPNYVLDDDFINNILNKNNIKNSDRKKIIENINKEKERIKKILYNNKIIDEINVLSEKEFKNYNLSLSKYFIDIKVTYDYEDYKKHIKLIERYEKDNKNYKYIINNNHIFKNINLTILDKYQVIICKENDPSIYFVIHHPKLVNAISNFEVQINEKDYTN